MPVAALRRAPLSVSDRRVLLFVSEAQAGPRATVWGSIEVSAASGMPARPYQDGHDLTFTDSAMPDGPAAMTVAEVPRRPLPTDTYYDPMIPHTLVLKPGLLIYSVYNGYWYWGRPSIEDLRRDLREVTREIRPHSELAAPGLRAEWDAGGHSRHYPYQNIGQSQRAGAGRAQAMS